MHFVLIRAMAAGLGLGLASTPVEAQQPQRARALGVAPGVLRPGRTGSGGHNGSGDYVIAFSTHRDVRRRNREVRHSVVELDNDAMSGIFQAVVEATEEAIYNSLFMATTVTSRQGTVRALPVGEVLGILRQHGALRP